jgi:hypothetical protein
LARSGAIGSRSSSPKPIASGSSTVVPAALSTLEPKLGPGWQGPALGAFWKPGDPALSSLPGQPGSKHGNPAFVDYPHLMQVEFPYAEANPRMEWDGMPVSPGPMVRILFPPPASQERTPPSKAQRRTQHAATMSAEEDSSALARTGEAN